MNINRSLRGGGKIYVIVVYDVEEERVQNVRKIILPFLFWIQNSVFIGEISSARFRILKARLGKVIDPQRDTVDFFLLRHEKLVNRLTVGKRKDLDGVII